MGNIKLFLLKNHVGRAVNHLGEDPNHVGRVVNPGEDPNHVGRAVNHLGEDLTEKRVVLHVRDPNGDLRVNPNGDLSGDLKKSPVDQAA